MTRPGSNLQSLDLQSDLLPTELWDTVMIFCMLCIVGAFETIILYDSLVVKGLYQEFDINNVNQYATFPSVF